MAGRFEGYLINLIGTGLTWLVWKYIVPSMSMLPVVGMMLMAIQPVITLIFKIWFIVLIIAGPLMILTC